MALMLYTYKYKEDLADAHRPNKEAPSNEQAAFLQSFTENANFAISLLAYRKHNLSPDFNLLCEESTGNG